MENTTSPKPKIKHIYLDAEPQKGSPLPRPNFTVKNRLNHPDRRNFLVIPKYCPFLHEQIVGFEWQIVQNQVTLEIQEKAGLPAADWFGGINERRERVMSTRPDAGITQDYLGVVFYDCSGNVVHRMKLRGLTLLDHKCALRRNRITATVSLTSVIWTSATNVK